MKLVVVYNSFSPADANLVCSSLQSAGLDAEVTNELSTLSLEGYALASGGIRVMVPEEQFAEARAIIDQANELPPKSE
jgi:type III secretory pathway lipoprotein EscJ